MSQSLLDKLKAGKRNTREIKYPGTDQIVMLQVLSNQDVQDAIFAAEKKFASEAIEPGGSTIDAYEAERSVQILCRALRDPEDIRKPLAANAGELRKLSTKEEISELIREYSDLERECSPNFAKMNDDDFEALWEDLKKNPRTLANGLSSATLRGLTIYLASRPVNAQKGSGST